VIEFLLKLGMSLGLAGFLWASAALIGHPIAWWIAAPVSLVLVFVAWLIIDRGKS
jgi:hypothetical protein